VRYEGVRRPKQYGLTPAIELEFRRGFVERIRTDAASLLAVAPALFAAEPVRELTVQCFAPRVVRRIAAARWLARLRVLEWLSLDADGLLEVLASPRAAALRACITHRVTFGTARARALAALPHLRELRVLVLRNAGLRDPALRALARAPGLGALSELHVGTDFDDAVKSDWNRIGDGGALALADSPHLRALRKLDLYGASLSRATLARLARRFGVDNFRAWKAQRAGVDLVAGALVPWRD
jgi:hypothetical protein